MRSKIKGLIEKHDKLYILARCIKNIRDPNLVKLLRGYYEELYDYTSLLALHNGEKFPDKVIYYIGFYVAENKKSIRRGNCGFCASLRRTLEVLNFADLFGMTPTVEWGRAATYYDAGMDSVTKNVFEYYFEPVSEVDYRDIKNSSNVVRAHTGNGNFFMRHATSYAESYGIEQDEIERLGYIYRKYIHLNEFTRTYIDNQIISLLGNKTVLAVHVRGTDFNQGITDHPIVISIKDYIAKAKDIYMSGKYEKLFLATDDARALKMFQQEFKDQLLYYEDAFRTDNGVGPHCTPNSRSLHYYRLGQEILREVYTLANCTSLICGLSQVSFAARYINFALNRKFNEVVVLNNGIVT